MHCSIQLELQGFTMLYVFNRANVVHIAWNAMAENTKSHAARQSRGKGPLSVIFGFRSV